jgi:hypothetical protein
LYIGIILLWLNGCLTSALPIHVVNDAYRKDVVWSSIGIYVHYSSTIQMFHLSLKLKLVGIIFICLIFCWRGRVVLWVCKPCQGCATYVVVGSSKVVRWDNCVFDFGNRYLLCVFLGIFGFMFMQISSLCPMAHGEFLLNYVSAYLRHFILTIYSYSYSLYTTVFFKHLHVCQRST